MKINCCNANGPRVFALLPQVAVMPMADKDGFVVNLYGNIESEQTLQSGKKVKIRMTTAYPMDDAVFFEIPGTDLDGEAKKPLRKAFCDFGSAGNTWDTAIRYRVWLHETLNIQKTSYKPYNE